MRLFIFFLLPSRLHVVDINSNDKSCRSEKTGALSLNHRSILPEGAFDSVRFVVCSCWQKWGSGGPICRSRHLHTAVGYNQ